MGRGLGPAHGLRGRGGSRAAPAWTQHVKNKDFWTHAVVFTSKDRNLNKAHIQFLESSLIDRATASKRCILDNGNSPSLPSLSSQDKADAELFLSDLLLCMPALGYGFFAPPPSVQTKGRIDYHLKARGIEARGYESSQGFVVRAASQAAKDEVDSIHAFLSASRADLLARGLLVDRGEHFELTQDYLFPTPSNAGGDSPGAFHQRPYQLEDPREAGPSSPSRKPRPGNEGRAQTLSQVQRLGGAVVGGDA